MKVTRWLVGWLIALALVSTSAHAQDAQDANTKNPEAYERLAAPLRLQPKQRFKFANTRLGDIIRLLAAEAEISFLALSDAPEYNDLISFNLELSPFAALEYIVNEHDIHLLTKGDRWSVTPVLSGKVTTIDYEHPYHSVTSPATQKQWPNHVSTLFRPQDRPNDTYDSLPTWPIVEIDFSIIQVEAGHDEILLGPQNDGPVTKIIRTNDEKSHLETLLANPSTRTISQRKLSLHPDRKVLLDHLSSEIVDGAKRLRPNPPPGRGTDLPDTRFGSMSAILPRGTQVALECRDTNQDSTSIYLSATQAGLRKGPEHGNPAIDIVFAATHHHSAINVPIGEVLVMGSFEEPGSLTNLHLRYIQKARKIEPKPDTKTILLLRPTKVIGLEWAEPQEIFTISKER